MFFKTLATCLLIAAIPSLAMAQPRKATPAAASEPMTDARLQSCAAQHPDVSTDYMEAWRKKQCRGRRPFGPRYDYLLTAWECLCL